MTLTSHDLPNDEALPNVEHLITEDDSPVDNPFQDKQQDLLMEGLFGSGWQPPSGKFVAFANVGLFAKPQNTTLVPDALLSLDVSQPEDLWRKGHRSYFMWLYGKPPDVVIEVVSNRHGHEDGVKLKDYARIGVPFYVIYDPQRLLSKEPLRLFGRAGSRLRSRKLVARLNAPPVAWVPDVGLGLTLWTGTYHATSATWLRWCDRNGQLLPTGDERADAERDRADSERNRADSERERADAERLRAERMAERLRQLGLDPE